MIDYILYCQIRSLHQEQKLSVGQIAKQLRLDKKTVGYWLKRDYHPSKRPGRVSKLDPYKPRIKAWLEAHDLSAQQVLQRLQAQGVDVRYTVVCDYVRLVRPKPLKAFLSLNFAPGECLQVDWGSWGVIPIGATRRRLSFFVAVRVALVSVRGRRESCRNRAARPRGSCGRSTGAVPSDGGDSAGQLVSQASRASRKFQGSHWAGFLGTASACWSSAIR